MEVKKIIKCSASWCQPCHVFAKTFEKVAEMEEYNGIKFEQIDIEEDENAELLVEKFSIRSVPTTLILGENDELIYKLSGNLPLKDFTEIINNALEK
jgi:thiol-disulfide isomerase/thioredoxin